MIVLELSLVLARQYLRNVLLVSLLIIVPTVFISTSYYTTRATDIEIIVTFGGGRRPMDVWMPDLHGAIMVPIVTAFLAGIAGLFVMLDASRADGRLAIAGVSPRTLAGTRVLLISAISAGVAFLAAGVTMIHSRPQDVAVFTFANLLVGLSYGFIGALAFLTAGRLGGAYLMLFVPMIDIGVFQDPMMISGEPPAWMKWWPGFGGTRLAIDAAFTHTGRRLAGSARCSGLGRRARAGGGVRICRPRSSGVTQARRQRQWLVDQPLLDETLPGSARTVSWTSLPPLSDGHTWR